MSSSERSPKRQRTSLSPNSPAYHQYSPVSPNKVGPLGPQTPISPSRMSSTNHGSPGIYSQTFPTPPLTAGLSSNMLNMIGASSMSQDTPMSMSRDGDREAQVTEQEDVVMGEQEDHRRTDHERQPVEMGPPPLLCRTSHTISAPHPSQNLVSLYGLDNMASSVARRDPLTGEKINKLRKSYEGKVKNQGLPGRNKPTDRPGELLGFMEWPEEGWYDQRVRGFELENALNSGSLLGRLDRALSMQPGRLPTAEHEQWKGVLGLEDPVPGVKTPSIAPSKTAAQSILQRSHLTSMRASAPASPRGGVLRPDRAGKKRRYDDRSFEGYADGYQDDDGYSTAGGTEDRRNSAGRKRRREYSVHDPSASGGAGFEGSNTAHFNSTGMVGVKTS